MTGGKKGRSREEVEQIICWLTGYSTEEIKDAIENSTAYGDFFRNAPALNPNRKRIKGVICGVRVEDIEEPLMQEIRYLDKLVDELVNWKKHNLIQFAAFQKHIGLYPGPEAVEAFADRLQAYKTSKGTIQFPYDKPLPLTLIAEIAKWCEKEYS